MRSRAALARGYLVLLLIVVCAGSALALLLLPGKRPATPQQIPLAFSGVTVVDVNTGQLRPNVSVVIEGDRIRFVGPSSAAAVPSTTRIVDAKGMYAIPGLWDMHTHAVLLPESRAVYPALLVANGVTGIRSMDTNLPPGDRSGREPRPRLEQSEPRLFASGRMVNGPGSRAQSSVIVRAPSDVAAALDQIAQGGSEFVKVYNGVPRAAYFSLLSEAHRRGLDVVGHVPWSIRALEAADSGQKSIEHLSGILLGCSSREHELIAQLEAARADTSARLSVTERKVNVQAAQSFEAGRCTALAQELVRTKVWQTPTLVNLRGRALQQADVDALLADHRFQYEANGEKRARRQLAELLKRPQREREVNALVLQRQVDAAIALQHAGASFLAGTDLPAAFAVPGFSLHDELELLVTRVGLSPLEALQAATSNPARFFAADSLGSVEAGKLADFILLAGNPLEDIRNTRRIEGVVLAGRYLDQTHLQGLLNHARREARWRRWTTFMR